MFDSDARRRRELQAMRDRHKQKFMEATATLRAQYKTMTKRAKALEMQLIRNSVRTVDTRLNAHGHLSHTQVSM